MTQEGVVGNDEWSEGVSVEVDSLGGSGCT